MNGAVTPGKMYTYTMLTELNHINSDKYKTKIFVFLLDFFFFLVIH